MGELSRAEVGNIGTLYSYVKCKQRRHDLARLVLYLKPDRQTNSLIAQLTHSFSPPFETLEENGR